MYFGSLAWGATILDCFFIKFDFDKIHRKWNIFSGCHHQNKKAGSESGKEMLEQGKDYIHSHRYTNTHTYIHGRIYL